MKILAIDDGADCTNLFDELDGIKCKDGFNFEDSHSEDDHEIKNVLQ
jgi:hypothetical protein